MEKKQENPKSRRRTRSREGDSDLASEKPAVESFGVLSNRALMEQWPHDMELMEEIRRRSGDTVILAFSRGKDSIAAWLALKRSGLFKRIIPYHNLVVPGLKFVEESLAYFEDVFHTHIYRLPHLSFLKQIGGRMFIPPGRILQTIDYFYGFTGWTQQDYDDWFRGELGLFAGTLVANGVRAVDSLNRRMALHRTGPFGDGKIMPIWNWSTKKVKEEIAAAGIELPVDYEIYGRSFDGLGYQYMKGLKERFPEDYERVKKWFPLIDLEIFRYEGLEDKCDFSKIDKNGRVGINYAAFK